MELLWVCLGAATGAPARYLVDRAVRARHQVVLPWPTLVVNVVGAFALGALVGWGLDHDLPEWVTLALGTGFCGALTTWSALGNETLTLARDGRGWVAVLNVALSLGLGVGAAFLGYGVGQLG